jgi:hypothetical protein
MTREVQDHPAPLLVCEQIPQEVPIGSTICLKVKLLCEEPCDLRGGTVQVLSGTDVLASGDVVIYDEAIGVSETSDIVLTAPGAVGDYHCTIVFPDQEIRDVVYASSSLPCSFSARPHAIHVAAWGLPASVGAGDHFTVTVGAKSSAEYPLNGMTLEVSDEQGTLLGIGKLGDSPWPGTSALYWTEIEMTAPAAEGLASYSARFAGDMAVPHEIGSAQFTVVAIRNPEHAVTVRLVEKDTGAPLADAQVRLGAYAGVTDAAGVARVDVPKGTYAVSAWKPNYLTTSDIVIDVDDDVSVQLEGEEILRDDPWGQFV